MFQILRWVSLVTRRRRAPEGEEALENRTYSKHYSTIFPAEITLSESSEDTFVFFVGGDAYTAPVAIINGEDHYLHRDHLGSVLAISDASGAVVEERQFTAWGAVEEFKKNGIIQEDFTDSILMRGFTGHEHFDQIKLIHMNGRMYDPQLKRFLSPDNNIQDPFDTRSYDRFSYVWHNPLMNTDPSGEAFLTVLLAVVKIVGFIVAGHQVLRTAGAYATGYYTGWRPLASALLQIGLSVLNVGQAIGSTLFSSTSLTVGQTIATAAITGFATGVLGSVIAGANIGDALKSGFVSAGIASAVAGLEALDGAGAGVKANAGKKNRTKGAGRPTVEGEQVTTPGVRDTTQVGGGEYNPDWWNDFQNQIPEVLSDGSVPSYQLPLYSGAATPMGFDSPFFVPSLAARAFSLVGSAAKGSRVFWSGGDIAKNSAMNFAKANGMKTLEMTTSGRIMNTVSPYLPRSISSPIWDGLSRNFARGATGNINVFQNAAGVSLRSTWRRIEYPILQNNNIIFHTVK